MQFTRYINNRFSLLSGLKSCSLLTISMTVLLASGCSTTPESNNSISATQGYKNLAKELIDFVGLLPDEPKSPSELANTSKDETAINNKNSYLEQEARLLSDVPKEVVTTFKQAVMLMEKQKWQKAFSLFDDVIAKQDNLSGSYVNQALILKKLSELEKDEEKQQQHLFKSEALIDAAINANSLNPYAWHLKGQLLQDKGKFTEAEKSYAEALSIWPSFPQAQLSMAILLELYQGKFQQAYVHYAAYLLTQGDDKQVRRWQAALAIKIKRAGLALAVEEGE